MYKRLNKHFTKEDFQMAKKQVISELPSKNSRQFHHKLTKMEILKRLTI